MKHVPLLLSLVMVRAEDVKVIGTEEDVMPEADWRVELESPLHNLLTATICGRFYTHQFR